MAIAVRKSKKRRVTGLERKETIAAYLFLSPWIIGFIVFLLIPIGMAVYSAFTKWTIINPPPRYGADWRIPGLHTCLYHGRRKPVGRL